jgi:hypothetical protein
MSYTLIERRELTSSTDSIELTSIPQIYSDIVLFCSLRERDTNNYTLTLGVNGSTSSNLTARILQGSGSSTVGATTTSPANFTFLANPSSGAVNTFGNAQIYISNYRASTNKFISIDSVTELNQTESYQRITAGLWSNTEPITGLTITGGLAAGSSISLYGINRQQAIGKPKAIGGVISFANGHWYHTFTGSGTFMPQEDLDVDALVIAGGGGGGRTDRPGGGGGAGGLLTFRSQKILKGATQVTVGSGGAAAPGNSANGFSGSNSSFANLTSTIGGGWGSGLDRTIGGPGGSGGGLGHQSPTGTGGAGTSGQGFAGGGGYDGGYPGNSTGFASGGGGGAGGSGGNGTVTLPGNGGPGLSLSDYAGATFTGVNGFYAGGGGGAYQTFGGTLSVGSGGSGGGGGGAFGSAGVANTGSGGVGGTGSNATSQPAGNGGSGIVIIRYKA